MFLVNAAERGLEGVICVAVDNSPYAGTFLADPGLPGAAVFSRTDVAADASFAETAAQRSAAPLRSVTAASAPELYLPGQPIVAASASGSGLTAAPGGGVLRLAGPLPGGACAEGAAVPLMGGSGAWSCRQRAPAGAAECAALSPASVLGPLRVAAAPTAALSDAASPLWLPVNVTSAVVVSAATGARSNVSSALLPSVTAAGGLGGTAGTLVPEAGGLCTCLGALVAVSLDLSTASTGTLSSAGARVTVADLPGVPCAAGQTTPNASAAAAGAFSLSTSVSFPASAEAAAAVSASLESNNIVARSRSGNPGYAEGSPVLAGVLVSDPAQGSSKTAVLAAVQGLQLAGPGAGGACVSPAASAVPVRVGEDVVVACSLTMTAAQLQAHCTAAGAGAPPLGLAGGLTHVGMLGNADPLRATHWLRIDGSALSASPTWDAASRTCQGAVVGFELQLLAAPVGEASNPQTKIIAAASRFVTGPLVAGPGPAASTFALTSTVSFAAVAAGGLDRFVPPPPSVLALPHDLFYPFQINDVALASAAGRGPSPAALALAAALVALGAAGRQLRAL